MSDCCEGVDCGRSNCPCKQETLNSSEESHSSLNSNEGDSSGAEWIDVRNFSERVVGKDGNYYDCDVCHEVGTLLCCDTCPSTFHLDCLEPPLKSAPVGAWQCQKCWPQDGSSASASKSLKRGSFTRVKHSPSSNSLSLGKKRLNETSYVPADPNSRSSAINQLPAALSLSLDKLVEAADLLAKASEADAHSESQGKSANNRSGEEGTLSGSKMGELKVYERSVRKKKVQMEDGDNLGALSKVASDDVNEDHKDKPAHNPVETDGTPVEKQEKAVVVCQDLNERPYSESRDVILQDKLLIPRDVSQASADGHFFSQNNESSDSQLEEHLSDEEAKARKERLAYLRARQKARISQRVKKVGGPSPGSRPSSNEGSVQSRNEGSVQFHGQNSNGFSGLSKKSSGIVPIAATPLRMIRPEDAGSKGAKRSSDKTGNRENFLQNHSVNSNQKRLNHNQEGFGDQFPGFPIKRPSNPECLSAAGVKRQKMGVSEFPSPSPCTLPPQPRDVYHRKTSTSDYFSGFPMPSAGYNHWRTMDVDETWSNKELDSLWVGVRKYSQGNWLLMLTDPNLCFSRGKTAADLAKRWEKEKAKHFGPEAATNVIPSNGKRRMIDIDLNLEPSESSGKAKSDEPKMLLGIHIEIPVIQPVPEAGGVDANRMQMQEEIPQPAGMGANRMQIQAAVPRPGGMGTNRMQIQAAVPRPGGMGANRMQIQAAVPRPGGMGANRMQIQAAVPRPGGNGTNRMLTQEAVFGRGGNGANRMQEVVEISSDSDSDANTSDSEATIYN